MSGIRDRMSRLEAEEGDFFVKVENWPLTLSYRQARSGERRRGLHSRRRLKFNAYSRKLIRASL